MRVLPNSSLRSGSIEPVVKIDRRNGRCADGTGVSKIVLLTGRRDRPTDGVHDYCDYLGCALRLHGIEVHLREVAWDQVTWPATVRAIFRQCSVWKDSWVMLQYTTLAWSRRGLPFGAWVVLLLLRWRGLRCAVVFHEATRQTGERWIDRLRGMCQHWVIRHLYSGANMGIFLDPLDKIDWLPHNAPKAVFIPIGANIPESDPPDAHRHDLNTGTKTVAVFCLSDPPNRHRELADIAHAMQVVAQHGVKARVVFLGRGTEEAREEIERMFDSSTGEAVNLGLQSADEVRRILSESDAMLCVRGPLYMRRGSAIAGIACGLPIVGYAGAADGTPLEEAGVELVPYLDRAALGSALYRVLCNPEQQTRLASRSREAQRKYFCWDRVAASVASCLEREGEPH